MINMPPYFGTIYSREHQPVVFTSNPFPYYHEDTMVTRGVNPVSGWMRSDVYSDNLYLNSLGIQGGTLTETIRYISYVPPYPDQVFCQPLAIQGGTLTETIRYISYSNPNENLYTGGISIQGGTLNTTIVYLSYTPATEQIYTGGISIQAATLG